MPGFHWSNRSPVSTLREIADIVRWGVENQRSPEDIRADLDARHRQLGGTGPVELPEGVELPTFEDVETPAGMVTLTAEEAAAYREALRQAERLPAAKESLREAIVEIEEETRMWAGWERMSDVRAVAGIYDLWERQAMREWETRDSQGRYFEETESTRREIEALEASVEHIMGRPERRRRRPWPGSSPGARSPRRDGRRLHGTRRRRPRLVGRDDCLTKLRKRRGL
jgi:hypothetical protein